MSKQTLDGLAIHYTWGWSGDGFHEPREFSLDIDTIIAQGKEVDLADVLDQLAEFLACNPADVPEHLYTYLYENHTALYDFDCSEFREFPDFPD